MIGVFSSTPRPMLTRLAKFYLSLAPVQLQPYQIQRQPLQRAEMEYKDECVRGFLRWFPNLQLRGLKVLDLGSGYGGRTIRFAEMGAAQVTGLEIRNEMAEEGSQFAASRGVTSVEFVTGFGEELPFRDNCFDAITSVDVFEHVEDLEKVLRECWRVLKAGGTLYAVFPPFYQLLGGSHLHGYISKSPGPNLIFSNKVLLEAINAIVAERNDGYRPNALRPKDKLPGMNGTTIKGFKKILRGIPFSHTRVRLDPLFSPYREQWESLHMRYYGFLSRPLGTC